VRRAPRNSAARYHRRSESKVTRIALRAPSPRALAADIDAGAAGRPALTPRRWRPGPGLAGEHSKDLPRSACNGLASMA
jgi:hypothetical protein